MYIENLHLINYRSFEELHMSFHEKLTVIVGGNGVGKTSIIEALAIACGTFFLGLDNVKSASIKSADVRYSYYNIGSGLDSQQQFPVSILAEGSVGGKALWWRRSLMTLGGKTTYGEASQLIRISKEYRMRLMEGDDSLILPIIAYYGTGPDTDIIDTRYPILVRNHGHFQKIWSGSRGLIHHAEGRKPPPKSQIAVSIEAAILHTSRGKLCTAVS